MDPSSTSLEPSFCILTFLSLVQLLMMIPESYVETSNIRSNCALQNSETSSTLSYSRGGDIIIGGILQINMIQMGETPTYFQCPVVPMCTMPSFQYLLHFLAFIYAVDEINNSTDILPNITLGFQVYDVCDSQTMAMKGTLNVLSESEQITPNYNCQKTPKLAAFIGHLLSSPTNSIAHLTQLYGYPQVAYGAPDLSFTNLKNFPYVYDMYDNENNEFRAIIQLLLHFDWKWVGIISSNDHNSVQASEQLKKAMEVNQICTEFHLVLRSTDQYNIPMANQTIRKSTANVLILYLSSFDFIVFTQNDLSYRKVCIISSTVNAINEDVFQPFFHSFNGSLLISVPKREVPGFKTFLSEVSSSSKDNALLVDFADMFLCCVTNESVLYGLECHGTVTTWKELLLTEEMSSHRNVHAVHSAVHLIAKALNEMYLDSKVNKTSTEKKHKLNSFLKTVHREFHGRKKSFSGEPVDTAGSYDILNWIISPDSKVKVTHIGSFLASTEKLLFNDSAFVWKNYFRQVPRSLCSEECPIGHHRIPKIGKLFCCFDCVSCPEGEISNASDSGVCEKCPEYQWPNPSKNVCINKTIDILSYDGHLGISLSTITITLSVMNVSVLWVFVKHRNTPIVKANNLNLSYILLVSLMLSFLCSFLFIGFPTQIKCLIRQATFGIIFSVSLSSVLGKTVTVVIAFNATRPRSRIRYWMGPRISILLTMVCSLTELVLSVFCLMYSPPFVDIDKTVKDNITPQCNEGTISIFYVSGFYLALLAMCCFLVAFSSRKLPDRYNEAQYITFSMLVFCSVWVSFIPTYLSTKGKYMVAVEIFAILASAAGLLFCIFMPKCHLILLKPEVNIKRSSGSFTQRRYCSG